MGSLHMNLEIDGSSQAWAKALKDEFAKPYYLNLEKFLIQEYSTRTVYPAFENIFKAFNATPLEKVRVVILGQDPYHGKNQATGMGFSVPKGEKIPPSLRNIYKEAYRDLNQAGYSFEIPSHGDLSLWAREGVLILNTVLTVREGEAGSHRNMGWEIFSDRVIQVLNSLDGPLVFCLWGRPAQEKISKLTNSNHLLLQSSHPSPLSANRGFLGCGHFSKANDFFRDHGLPPINWRLDI